MTALLAIRMFGGELTFVGLPMVWVIVLGALAAVAVAVLYATESARLGFLPRTCLALIRVAIVAVVAFLLLLPTLERKREERKQRPIAVLIDTSQSMRSRDPRPEAADLWRLAIATGKVPPEDSGRLPVGTDNRLKPGPSYTPGKDQPPWPSRLEIAQSALALPGPKFDLLGRLGKHGTVEVSAFGEGPTPTPAAGIPQLQANETRTAIAESALQIVERAEPISRPAAVVIVTDGRENGRRRTLRALVSECKKLGIPLHVYGVGATALGQAQIRQVGGPETLFVDNDVAIPIEFRISGVSNASVELSLHYGKPGPDGLPQPAGRALDAASYTVTRGKGFGPLGKDGKMIKEKWDPEQDVLILKLKGVEVERRPIDEAGGANFIEQKLSFRPTKEDLNDGNPGESKVRNRDLVAKIIVKQSGDAPALTDQLARAARIADEKIRVLVIDSLPRWDFKYLQRTLIADEKRLEPRFLLLGSESQVLRADNVWAHELLGPRADDKWAGGKVDPSQVKLPISPDEFRKILYGYDVLILGDVPDRFFDPDHQDVIAQFVAERGGGLIHIAGRTHAPTSWFRTPDTDPIVARTRKKTLADVLPVEFNPTTFPAESNLVTAAGRERNPRPFFPQLAPGAERHPLVQLDDDPLESAERWGSPDLAPEPDRTLPEFARLGKKLPPLYWFYPVTRLKPAAEVFLIHPFEKTTDNQPMPLLAGHNYGKGFALFVGIDETWRWRLNEAERYFGRFWRQAVYVAGFSRTMGSRLSQLDLDDPRPLVGNSGKVTAQLFDKDGRVLKVDRVKATRIRVDVPPGSPDREKPLVLTPVLRGGQPTGEYTADVRHDEAGKFAVHIEPDGGEPATLEYRVGIRADDELAPGGLAETELRGLAAETGGGYYREENLASLPDNVKPQFVTFSHSETELLLKWEALFLLVILLTLEWIVRKFNSLS